MTSEYNAFLEALIGDARNGMPISVISAFARFGLDPWIEAERLSGLPREGAVAELGRFIDSLPDGAWLPAETIAIAGRLMALLPKHRALRQISRQHAGKDRALDGAAPEETAPGQRTAPRAGSPDPAEAGRAGPGIPISGGTWRGTARSGGGGRRRISRMMMIAILLLAATAAAAFYDARYNRDRSMVPDDRQTIDQL